MEISGIEKRVSVVQGEREDRHADRECFLVVRSFGILRRMIMHYNALNRRVSTRPIVVLAGGGTDESEVLLSARFSALLRSC